MAFQKRRVRGHVAGGQKVESVPFWATDDPTIGPAGPVFAEDSGAIGSAWDTVSFGGIRLPGVCEVRVTTAIELDKKKAKGTDGATLTVTGYQPASIEITCTVWTKAQWSWLVGALRTLLPHVQRQSQLDSVAVDVSHPALQVHKINSCVVSSIVGPEAGSVVGTKIVRLKCIENKGPTLQAVKTAKGSSVGRTVEYASGSEPKNSAAARPSANQKNLSPAGQPAAPSGGTH